MRELLELKEEATRGIKWLGVTQILTYGLSFIVLVTLRRLLLPEDFGIIGMAGIFIVIIGVFSDIGLSSAIIQRKEINESHLSTSFWTNVIIGLALCGITAIFAPFTALFFANELVEPVMKIMGLSFIIVSFGIIQRTLLTKNMDFKRLALSNIGEVLIGGSIGITLALSEFGVWSIVWGQLTGRAFGVFLLWLICSWRPLLKWSIRSFKELFGFGVNVLGFSIVDFATRNIDNLLVGKFLGATSLGFYSLAYSLVTFPQLKLSHLVGRVTFPVFSKIQDDDERLRSWYLKTVQYISLISFPLLSGLFCVAPEFVRVIYKEKWSPAILPVQILCAAGLIYSVAATVGSVILAKGKSSLLLKIGTGTFLTLLLSISIGMKWGLVGIASAVSSCALVLVFIIQAITNSVIKLKMKHYLKSLFPATIASVIMILVLLIMRRINSWFLNLNDLSLLIGLIIIGALTYFVSFKALKIKALDELICLLLETLNPSRNE